MIINHFAKERVSIPRSILDDPCISWKSKAIMCQILSLTGVFSIEEIMKYSKSGRYSVMSAMRELEKNGYLKKDHDGAYYYGK